MHLPRWISPPATALATLLLLMGAPACDSTSKAAGTETQVARVYVKVLPVQAGTLERTLELTAAVEAGRSANLVSDIPGKIKSLPVKVGDEVKAGAVLARLDTDMARFQADQATAATRLADLGLQTAKREFGRAESLYNSKSLTDQQFEQARAGLEMATQQKAQAEAMKGLADKQVRGGSLTAPFDGVVSMVCCEPGEYFNPMTISPMGGPQGLVSLVNLDTVRIDLQVSDRDISNITKGMNAHINVDSVADLLPADGLLGTVESVGLAADSATRTFPVRIIAPNPGHVVKAGTHARVRLVLASRDGVLSVPASAIREDEGKKTVMVVVGGKVRRIEVTTGLEGNDAVEIVSGLHGSEPVIRDGSLGLPEGAPVEITE